MIDSVIRDIAKDLPSVNKGNSTGILGGPPSPEFGVPNMSMPENMIDGDVRKFVRIFDSI